MFLFPYKINLSLIKQTEYETFVNVENLIHQKLKIFDCAQKSLISDILLKIKVN
jgi:hypothetical protein